jgi:hypothetical protein
MVTCPTCHQPATSRDGRDHRGQQRYACRPCHRGSAGCRCRSSPWRPIVTGRRRIVEAQPEMTSERLEGPEGEDGSDQERRQDLGNDVADEGAEPSPHRSRARGTGGERMFARRYQRSEYNAPARVLAPHLPEAALRRGPRRAAPRLPAAAATRGVPRRTPHPRRRLRDPSPGSLCPER